MRPEFKSKWSIYPPKPIYQPKRLEKSVFLPPSRVFWQCLNINQWTTSHIYLYTNKVEVGVTTSKTNTQTHKHTNTQNTPHPTQTQNTMSSNALNDDFYETIFEVHDKLRTKKVKTGKFLCLLLLL